MLSKNFNMPFLSLHALAAARGDGLRPEFVDLFVAIGRLGRSLSMHLLLELDHFKFKKLGGVVR